MSKWHGKARNKVHKAFFTMHPAPLCKPSHMEYGPKLTDKWADVTCGKCLKLGDRVSVADTSTREPDILERIQARKKGIKLKKVDK